ncbi:hypothetical protein cym2001_40820 [Pseudomonas sp. CYM-20-01]|nr:hypothetical protein cym2001_40820 [Pseudomonas sp. CYM-20-01]
MGHTYRIGISWHKLRAWTKNDRWPREEIIWSKAVADLNISEITGEFCAGTKKPI